MPTRRHFGSVRRLPSGRYQASYWHKAERHAASHTFVTKAEALAWLSGVETDIKRGAWVDPAGAEMTVAELGNRWLESDPAKRSSTRRRDELAIRLHIVPALASKKLAQVTPPDIQYLVNEWATVRAARTVRREYAVLRAMFAYAVGSDWLARSPCRRIKQPAIRPVVRPQLSPEDVDTIATTVGSRYSTMVWCGALLGLRWGEVAGLRVGDLDLLAGTLTISQQRPAHGPAGPPKSKAGERPLSMPAALVRMLAAHLSACGLTGADADSLVFTSPDGEPLDYSNWRRRIWVPAVRQAGFRGAGFHDLRRTNATQLVVSGVDIKTAQSRLGHADPRLTLAVYAQAVGDADRDAAARLDERFFGQVSARQRT